MLFAFAYSVLRLLLDIFDVRLRVRDPEAELLLLRHQLRVVRRHVKRPQLDMADRTIMAALSRRVGRASLVEMLVQPETILGWHRELVRRNSMAGASSSIDAFIGRGCLLRPTPVRARLCARAPVFVSPQACRRPIWSVRTRDD
jgi:hypothetical protein